MKPINMQKWLDMANSLPSSGEGSIPKVTFIYHTEELSPLEQLEKRVKELEKFKAKTAKYIFKGLVEHVEQQTKRIEKLENYVKKLQMENCNEI